MLISDSSYRLELKETRAWLGSAVEFVQKETRLLDTRPNAYKQHKEHGTHPKTNPSEYEHDQEPACCRPKQLELQQFAHQPELSPCLHCGGIQTIEGAQAEKLGYRHCE